MKKLIVFAFATVAMTMASCSGCGNAAVSTENDSVAVDSIDSVVVVDSVAVDSTDSVI